MLGKSLVLGTALVVGLSNVALAHFGMVIPSSSVVTDKNAAEVTLDVSFSHPMEGVGMTMARPKSFKVYANGKEQDLTAELKPIKVMDQDAWQARYAVSRPGVHQFVLEPVPYWEPAEDCFIIHYVKTCLPAYGEEDGWAEPLGVKTEIVPLTRPFGNYAGNVFQGRVLLDGEPVPGADVEVEYYNRDNRYAAPNDVMVTQVIRADANGVFTYSVPFAGWWGFAALNTAEEKLTHDGEPKNVELGAVLWTEFVDPVRTGK